MSKPNATGRNSRKSPGRRKPGAISGPFVALTLDMLTSVAWQALGINARRLLDRLMVEHLRHAGRCNGDLQVTYLQFDSAGLDKKRVKEAIRQATFLGFIRHNRDELGERTKVATSFRLTFLPTRTVGPVGDFKEPPTDEWRSIGRTHIEALRPNVRTIATRDPKGRIAEEPTKRAPQNGTTIVPFKGLDRGTA